MHSQNYLNASSKFFKWLVLTGEQEPTVGLTLGAQDMKKGPVDVKET